MIDVDLYKFHIIRVLRSVIQFIEQRAANMTDDEAGSCQESNQVSVENHHESFRYAIKPGLSFNSKHLI